MSAVLQPAPEPQEPYDWTDDRVADLRQMAGDGLASRGVYVLAWLKRPDRLHQWFYSLDAMLDAYMQHADEPDVYYGTATYRTKGTKASGRTQANVAYLRCLRVDIDVGPGKPYATTRAAVVDLQRSLGNGLPSPSYVLSSGGDKRTGGLHLYWCLAADVTPEVWKPIAKALGNACAALGLQVDTNVTADEARVLRLPGSLNSKTGKRTEILTRSGQNFGAADLAEQLNALVPAPGRAQMAATMPDGETCFPLTASDAPRSLGKVAAGAVVSADDGLTDSAMRDLADALAFLAPHAGQYDVWVSVGQALKSLKGTAREGEARDLFLAFSRAAPKFDGDEAVLKKWEQLGGERAGYRGIFASAKRLGWTAQKAAIDGSASGEVGPWSGGDSEPSGTRHQALAAYRCAWGGVVSPPPARQFVIGGGGAGLFPTGKSSVLAGIGGAMKTALAMSLGLHVAEGKPWAGMPVEAGAALVVSLEDDADELQRRLGAFASSAFADSPIDHMAKRVRPLALAGIDARLTVSIGGSPTRTPMVDAIIAEAEALADDAGIAVRLIVVDHARLAVGGDLNDSEAATCAMNACMHIANTTGAAVLLLCHSPKASITTKRSDDYGHGDVLGSGAFVDNARFAAVITGLDDSERKKFALDADAARGLLAFRVVKSNYSESGRTLYLKKTPVPDWGAAYPQHVELRPPLAAVTGRDQAVIDRIRETVEASPGRFTVRSLRSIAGAAGALKASETKVRAAIEEMVSDGRLVLARATADDVKRWGCIRTRDEVLRVA